MTTDGKPIALSDDDLDRVVGGNGLPGVGAVSPMNIPGMPSMDLETMMAIVQSGRTNANAGEVQMHVDSLNAHNDKLGKLNTAMGEVNALLGKFSGDAKPDVRVSTDAKAGAQEIDQLLAAAGVTGLGKYQDTISKSEANALKDALGAAISTVTRNQQYDVLRLQSLSNKRNEAFDLITNYLKKEQDALNPLVTRR